MVIKNIDKLRDLIFRADYNPKTILNDGLEFGNPFDATIELLVFLPEDNESTAFKISRHDLEEICMRNGMDDMPNEKFTDNLYEFIIHQASKYELENIKKECIEFMVEQVLNTKGELVS